MFMVFLRIIVVIAVIVATSAVAAMADGRVTLAVGNDAYQSLSRLDNPAADAGQLASVTISCYSGSGALGGRRACERRPGRPLGRFTVTPAKTGRAKLAH